MKTIIAGGGIGGLTAALTLGAQGHDVLILEAASELRPLGVGINILPHAGAVLARLGLVQALSASAIETAELVYFNRHGQRIWGEPRGRAAGHDVPQLSLFRAHLQQTLLDAVRDRLGPAALLTGRRLSSFDDRSGGVAVHAMTEDGSAETHEADLLVAADGIHSAARAHMHPDGPPVCWSGRILWRGVTYGRPFLTGASMIMAGNQDQKFVAYPVAPPDADGRQPINWIAELTSAEMPSREDWNRPGKLADFLPRFETWGFDWLDVPALIRNADAVYEFPMVDRDPLPGWVSGSCVLLGDAAHAMYPIGSNGASQAILDAEMLATQLATSTSIDAALHAYEASRLPATAAIVQANRGNGPEQCMQLAEERAPDGFGHVDDVFAPGELAAISKRYQVLTGLQRQEAAA